MKRETKFLTERALSLNASLGGSDARLIGDQEVVGSTVAMLVAFFRGDFIMKYFLWSFSPFC